MANYGQTILGAYNSAAATNYNTQAARKLGRENATAEYDDLYNQLKANGLIKTNMEGDQRGYVSFDMERAMETLPRGGLANYIDAALKDTNLTKYEGADGRLKQGKVVGVHKITAEEDPDNAGMYAIAIKNDKGVMSFLSRDRREVGVKEGRAANDLGGNPLLLDAEDIQKYADIGARNIVSRTSFATEYGAAIDKDDLEALKKKNERDDAVSALAKEGQKQGYASIGLNPDGSMSDSFDHDNPFRKNVEAEGQILTEGEGDTRPGASLDQTTALETINAGTKTGQGPNITGDNEERDIKGKPIPPRPELRKDDKGVTWGAADQKAWDKKYGPGGTLVAEGAEVEAKAETDKVEWSDPDKLWEDMPAFRQSNMNKAMKEIEHELGRSENQTAIGQDMFGEAGSPSTKQVKKVFDHLGLPTKSGVVTKDHWREAQTYMLALKGDPTAKTVTTLNQANNKTSESKKTLIENNEMPDADAATELQDRLISAEIGTMEDYLKWADEFLPPATRDYANWVVASMGSKTRQETLATYAQLSGQTQQQIDISQQNADTAVETLELNKIKERGNINARYTKLATADGQLLTGITENYDNVLDNYALDRETGQWRPLDGSDKPPLQIDTIIDKGGTVIANLRAAIAGDQFTTSASMKAANDRLNEMSGTMIEMLAAQGSDRGTRMGLGITSASREAWSDFGGPIFGLGGKSPTRATMGQPFNQMRGNGITIEKSDKIVFVTKAGEGTRETRNSVSKIVVANALFGASDKGAMAELDELLIKNGVKGINE